MKKSALGFTLIEILIVIAITAFLASLAVTNFNEQMPHRQLREASLELVGQLRLARQKAISKGADETVLFYPNARQYDASFLGMQTLPSHVRFSSENVTKNTYNESNLPNNGISFDDNRAIFNSNGSVDNMGAIYLTNSKKESVAITVNITGRVKKFVWNGHGWK